MYVDGFIAQWPGVFVKCFASGKFHLFFQGFLEYEQKGLTGENLWFTVSMLRSSKKFPSATPVSAAQPIHKQDESHDAWVLQKGWNIRRRARDLDCVFGSFQSVHETAGGFLAESLC